MYTSFALVIIRSFGSLLHCKKTRVHNVIFPLYFFSFDVVYEKKSATSSKPVNV